MKGAGSIFGIGVSLAVLTVGLAALSYGFPYGAALSETPFALYVIVALIASGVWAALPFILRRRQGARSAVLFILLIGLIMRGAMFFSLPVLEDDSYRYLWDGAVTANGLDPYAHAPAEAAANTGPLAPPSAPISGDLARLQEIAADNPVPHSRINYPYVSTIYPPLAQAAFAVAYLIDPFGMTGWRAVLLAADLITMGLLLLLLRAHRRDVVWSSVYWWNPIVILHGFGAGHMDLLLLPFLLAALLLATRKQIQWASVALAGAAAVKLWPVLLFPLIVRPLLRRPLALILSSVLFAAVITVALWPQLVHVVRPEAGLNAYASEWRTHAFLFAILEDVVLVSLADPGQSARLVVAGVIIALTGWLALSRADRPDALPALVTAIIAALIFLSPTGYPWYLIWLAPLLSIRPHPGLLGLVALAPLYWLRFYLGDGSALYQWGIVPVAFGLPLVVLILPALKRRTDDAFRHHHPSLG